MQGVKIFVTVNPNWEYEISFDNVLLSCRYHEYLFGLEGRKRLYTGQVESHSRSVMVTRWNKIWMGDVEASPRDLFLNQLSQQAATDLQRAVFPVLAMMTDAVGLFEKSY